MVFFFFFPFFVVAGFKSSILVSVSLRQCYQNSAALLELNHGVVRQVDLDVAEVGGLWLTTLLVFSHHFEGSYHAAVAHL